MQSKHGTGGNHEIFKGQSVQESRCEMSEKEKQDIARKHAEMDMPLHDEPQPEMIECEGCHRMCYAANGIRDWKQSGEFVCYSCQREVSDFALKMINGLNSDLDGRDAKIKWLTDLLEAVYTDIVEALEATNTADIGLYLGRAIGRLEAGGIE